MEALLTLILLLAAGIAVIGSAKPRFFGGGPGEIERRHPERRGLGEDEVIHRRKDDEVGGEGG